jgi:hypothetical protein
MIHPMKRYRQQRTLASFKRYWEECLIKSCRVHKRCTGGRRGTFSRIGMPVCMLGRPDPEMNPAEPDKIAPPLEPVASEGVCED